MRTNIEIDDGLMSAAIEASGARTKREAVERGLRELVRKNELQKVLDLHGKISWIGDLDAMRTD